MYVCMDHHSVLTYTRRWSCGYGPSLHLTGRPELRPGGLSGALCRDGRVRAYRHSHIAHGGSSVSFFFTECSHNKWVVVSESVFSLASAELIHFACSYVAITDPEMVVYLVTYKLCEKTRWRRHNASIVNHIKCK